jgi:hypothetical protein
MSRKVTGPYPDSELLGDWLKDGDGANYRWLHDKYERLVVHEDDLLTSRMEYFLLIQGALLTVLGAAYATAPDDKYLQVAKAVSLVGSFSAGTSAVILWKTRVSSRFFKDSIECIEKQMEGTPSQHSVLWVAQPFRNARQEASAGGKLKEGFDAISSPSGAFVASAVIAAVTWAVAVYATGAL